MPRPSRRAWTSAWIACALAAATLALACVPPAAHAQTAAAAGAPPAALQRDARAAFEEGRALSAEERWVDALAAFERSRALLERPATVFNIAAALVRLGRARDALATLDDLDRIADPSRDRGLLEQARELRESAAASVRRVALSISPSDARVEIDGAVLEGEGEERRATLDPGTHLVVVSREGYRAQRFELAPGDDAREVSLAPLDATIVVTSTVDEASITIDGAVRGVGRVESSVAPGGHVVALEAEGYLPFERRVELDPGERLAFEAALEPVPPGEDLAASPLLWGLVGGGVAVVVAVAIGVAFATAGTEPPYGGTSQVVIAPLGAF